MITLKDLLGLTEHQAKTIINDSGYTPRVTKRNGDYFVITMDYQMSRVNLKIEDDVVVSATIG